MIINCTFLAKKSLLFFTMFFFLNQPSSYLWYPDPRHRCKRYRGAAGVGYRSEGFIFVQLTVLQLILKPEIICSEILRWTFWCATSIRVWSRRLYTSYPIDHKSSLSNTYCISFSCYIIKSRENTFTYNMPNILNSYNLDMC